MEEYADYIQSIYLKQFDFICLTETWLKSPERRQFNAQKYHVINKPRAHTHPQARRGSGGVLLYVHSRIWESVQILDSPETDDRLWVKLTCEQYKAGKNIFIFIEHFYFMLSATKRLNYLLLQTVRMEFL